MIHSFIPTVCMCDSILDLLCQEDHLLGARGSFYRSLLRLPKQLRDFITVEIHTAEARRMRAHTFLSQPQKEANTESKIDSSSAVFAMDTSSSSSSIEAFQTI